MGQIKPEELKGLVRPEVKKGDEHKDKPYVALTQDGRQVRLDKGEASSLMKRLDKDRSRMEKSGQREPEREPEKRRSNPVIDREKQREWANSELAKQARRR